ncbi:MAG: DUF4340 domain-containing protein, partial [Desulfobacterales bacterium]
MKLKKEFFILVIIIVALVGYLIFKNRDRVQYQLPDLAKIEQNQISKLELTQSGKDIVLNKKDNAWYIAPHEYPADPEKINPMLAALEELKVTALVSESKNYLRYDLSPEKKITVKAWAGSTPSREVNIGKSAATFQHTYVTLPNDPNVYHARGNFRSKFDQSVDTLRDKLVLSVNVGDLHEIRIIEKGQTTVIRKRKSEPEKSDSKDKKSKAQWETKTGQTIDSGKLEAFLAFFSRLYGDKYIDQKQKSDFQDPVYQINFIEKKEHSLSFFDKIDPKAGNYPGISSANPYPF